MNEERKGETHVILLLWWLWLLLLSDSLRAAFHDNNKRDIGDFISKHLNKKGGRNQYEQNINVLPGCLPTSRQSTRTLSRGEKGRVSISGEKKGDSETESVPLGSPSKPQSNIPFQIKLGKSTGKCTKEDIFILTFPCTQAYLWKTAFLLYHTKRYATIRFWPNVSFQPDVRTNFQTFLPYFAFGCTFGKITLIRWILIRLNLEEKLYLTQYLNKQEIKVVIS